MDLEDMVDVARYGSLLGHLVNNPDIDMFMAVTDSATPIWKIGEVLVADDVPAFQKLMDEGKVKLAARLLDGINDTSNIPHINSVECLYLPPIYLVKDRGVPHI